MFEVVFLGTSAAAPSIHRNLSGHMILAADQRFLLDCGEGTQRQILRSGIGFKRLHHVLLTHAHLDHILGLGGLVSTLSRWEGIESLAIFGGKHTLNRVERLIYGVVLDAARSDFDIRLIDIGPGVIWESSKFQVRAFPARHRGRSNFGYIFEERSFRPFLVDRAEELSVPAGPERRQLVLGNCITLVDGRTIAPDDVLGAVEKGTKVVFGGDGESNDDLLHAASGADLLISEATFLEEEAEEARNFGHTTAKRAARLAKQAEVKNLILTHFSRRYREREILVEARNEFPQARLARDLDHYVIKRGGKMTQKKKDAKEIHDRSI